MSLPAESKTKILVLLLAWPGAVLVGWLIARLTHAQWPIGAVPMVWLAYLFVTLRQHASDASDSNDSGDNYD
ncbi:MAG: hypothetical protein JWM57_3686 [Phycisphaerales bacterium]|nr:hypothetical protein [Phycisphaerales bacterium]